MAGGIGCFAHGMTEVVLEYSREFVRILLRNARRDLVSDGVEVSRVPDPRRSLPPNMECQETNSEALVSVFDAEILVGMSGTHASPDMGTQT
jgi:hypothetical protein